MEALIERWIPTLLASLLFFQVVRMFLGEIIQRITRGKILLIVGALVLLGIVPLALVRDVLIGAIVFLYDVVRAAYHAVALGSSAM